MDGRACVGLLDAEVVDDEAAGVGVGAAGCGAGVFGGGGFGSTLSFVGGAETAGVGGECRAFGGAFGAAGDCTGGGSSGGAY
jgi:hypothetical protein